MMRPNIGSEPIGLRLGAPGSLRRAIVRFFVEPPSRPERNPDEHRLESLDDWILFGPRQR